MCLVKEAKIFIQVKEKTVSQWMEVECKLTTISRNKLSQK